MTFKNQIIDLSNSDEHVRKHLCDLAQITSQSVGSLIALLDRFLTDTKRFPMSDSALTQEVLGITETRTKQSDERLLNARQNRDLLMAEHGIELNQDDIDLENIAVSIELLVQAP